LGGAETAFNFNHTMASAPGVTAKCRIINRASNAANDSAQIKIKIRKKQRLSAL